jgi:hypothetical protein
MFEVDNETKQRERDETTSLFGVGGIMLFVGVATVFYQVRNHIGDDLGDGLFATGVILAAGGLYALYKGFMRVQK